MYSVLSRKGTGQNITRLNETTKNVHPFSKCAIKFQLYIYNYLPYANRSLFDNNDPSGVHKGINKSIEQLYSYMSNVEQVDSNCRTPWMRKRNISSTTPQSPEQLCKPHKSGTPSDVIYIYIYI